MHRREGLVKVFLSHFRRPVEGTRMVARQGAGFTVVLPAHLTGTGAPDKRDPAPQLSPRSVADDIKERKESNLPWLLRGPRFPTRCNLE